MQTKSMSRIFATGLMALLMSLAVCAQERTQKIQQKTQPKPSIDLQQRPDSGKGMRPPSGPSFYISPLEGSTSMFSVLLGDGAGNTVAGTFTAQQIVVFEAVLQAAQAFALTDEKVGSGKPITTRLMEQHEWSLFVDVSKIGNQSRFYISLVTPQGNLTAEAGEITRGSKKEPSALLLDALSQVQAIKAAMTPQQ